MGRYAERRAHPYAKRDAHACARRYGGTALLRSVGAATALYGLAVTAVPELLAKPSGLTEETGDGASQGHRASEGRSVPEGVRVSLRPLAWRDAVSGLALLLAAEGAPLRTAALVRIAADFGDAALLGATLPDPDRRRKAVAVSVGWGALSVAGLLASGRARTGDRRGTTRAAEARQVC